MSLWRVFTQEQLARIKAIVVHETPRDTGTLQNSIVIIALNPFGIMISWNTSYAMLVNVRGKSAGYQERARSKVEEYVRSIMVTKPELNNIDREKDIVTLKPNKVMEKINDKGQKVRTITDKYRGAVVNPNMLQHPDDIFTSASIAEKMPVGKLRDKWTQFSDIRQDVRTGTIQTKESGAKVKSLLGGFLMPSSTFEPGAKFEFSKAKLETYIKMTQKLFKDKVAMRMIAKFNSYSLITNPSYESSIVKKKK